MSSRPLWLGAPGIRDFLNLLVDRLDSAELRSSGKAQSIALTEKVWPALFKAPFESAKEELWEHVVEMCNWGWLKVKPEAALKSASGYAASPRIVVVDVAAVRQAVGRTERVKSSVERWRKAVNRGLLASEKVREAVGEFCIDMPDHSMDEVVERLNELPALATQPLLLREASARLFWGMSKVLDKRQGLVAAVLGVDECPFPESPIQMQVYLPEGGYAAALFIENQMTFEQAIRSTSGRFDRLALLFASGFKGSAQRLRSRAGCSLFYSSHGALDSKSRVEFENWLFGAREESKQAFFWGDLDHAGMRILAAIRASFPNLAAWEPGYAPMLARLLAGDGHSPEAADKQGQRPIAATGCRYADGQLLPALCQRAAYLDQEFFAL